MHSRQDEEQAKTPSSQDATRSNEQRSTSSDIAATNPESAAESNSASLVTDGVPSDPDGPVTSTFPFLGAPNAN